MSKAKILAVALIALCVPVPAMAADTLGRLFFTPAQRSILDAGKRTVTKAPVNPGPRTVRVDGVVTRSDSERTIWINGKPYYKGAPEGVQVQTNPATPGSTSIRMQGKPGGTRVKVGQQIDLNSGRIEESPPEDKTTTEPTAVPADTSASRAAVARKPRSTDEEETPPVREKAANKTAEPRSDNATVAPAAR